MTPTEGILLSKTLYAGNDRVRVGNGSHLPIKHMGSLNIPTVSKPHVLRNVLHVLALKYNLLSVKQLYHDNHCIVVFDDSSVCVKDKISGKVLLHASSTGNVYPLAVPGSSPLVLLLLTM